ncbi:MAG: GNAT family N-acetyltransferase [Acidimicrobiales bacterium]|nr:GNAT family N-acetyltransferase [Acidimicrobiales bacterium]MCB9395125.1 GNAT family N-acetyltransferase [Acidimicrobiaceae bacterium]
MGGPSAAVPDRASTTELVGHLRDAVRARTPVDARERAAIVSFVEQLDRLEHPFDEHAAPVHVTASAIVVCDTVARGVVLHRHKRLGLWLQPGGHVDAGETPWDAARREAEEETGLPVTFAGGAPQLVHVDVHPGPRRHTHLDVRYLLTAPDVPPRPPAGESQDVHWFAWHRAVAMAEPGLEGVLRALQPGTPTLRDARGNDAADLAHVYLRSREFGLPEVPSIHTPGSVKSWFADEVIGHGEVTVAELDGTVVGLLVLEPGAAGTGWIEQLYVDPAWIGRGLGARLLERARYRFPAGLQLWTFQANERARRFYARAGFAEVEFTDGSGNEERAPDVRCEWAP